MESAASIIKQNTVHIFLRSPFCFLFPPFGQTVIWEKQLCLMKSLSFFLSDILYPILFSPLKLLKFQ